MSEDQSIAPDSNSTPPSPDFQVDSVNPQATSGIEKRQILSPVSPHPVHITEPSTIPVLNNQMDPALFNYTADAHAIPTYNSGTDVVSQNANSLDSLLQHQQLLQQPNQVSLTNSHTENQQMPNQPHQQSDFSSSVALCNSAAPANGSYSTVENSSVVANGDIPPGNESKESAQINGATPSKPSNITTSGVPKLSLPNNLSSNVDLQALLTKLSPATPNHFPASHTPPRPNGTPTSNNVPGATGVQSPSAPAPLPPRTQSPVAKTRIASNPPPPPANHPLPPVPVVSSSVPGHPAAGYPASLPPPPNFKAVPTTDDEDDEDSRPFTVDEEDEFSSFLTDERDYVTQGQWDRFPPGSRLFIGNLPTEKVTKRDLFRIFRKHGRLAQVSIKQAYGFVQFLDQSSCASALRNEQGSSVRGRKMHLEISKPQRNTRPAQVDSARPRRSRSPDYARGSNSPRRGGPPYRSSATAGPREVDRYRGAPSDRDSRDRGRDRDDYGSRRRSPLRVRDDYRPGRRSRSRSPPARYRPRSRSPESDDVPLPRRAPGQVPEVQILVSDELDRNFIWWVEQAFRQRGATCDMLFLNPRLQLSAVVKRQVLEGVQAVVFLNRQMQQASQISIQIFDRRGDGEASFDQYDNLDPPIAAELVIRAKQSLQQHQQQLTQTPPVTQYGSYGVAPPVQQPAAPVAPQQTLQHLGALGGVSGLANLLGTLDPNSLQTLIAGLQQPQQPSQHQQPQYQPQPQPQQQMPQLGADLASLLAGAGAARQQQSAPQPQQAAQYGGGMNAFGGSAGLAALLGQAQQKVASHPHQSQQPQTQQPTQPNAGQIGNIMETLAKWKQS